ncbi:MAG: DUF2326 domain-containing protein [Clostridia bacterium]|nr:DUF2326 domain-containing protein [Clostridia bacterium]
MKLLKLTADKKSFHPIEFKDGINVIVGKKTTPDKKVDGNTFNGVGKSLIVHLIHFCLCSNKIETLENKLPNWTFTLLFAHNNKEHSISRNTSNQGQIVLDGESKKLNEVRKWLLEQLGLKDEKISFQTILSSFVRRSRACYIKYNQTSTFPDDYKTLLNNGFLLGLDTELIIKKKELRTEQENLNKTERMLKNDPVFKEYYCGKSDAQLDRGELELEIERLKRELAEFKVSNNYHEIEQEANDVSFEKKEIENQIVIIENNIKNIKHAMTIQAEMSLEKVIQMYESASVEISDMLKKTLQEVKEFHNNLILTRNNRLTRELKSNELVLREKQRVLESLGTKMDQLLQYLNTHGALEEYTALNQKLSDLQMQLNHIKEYQNMLKTFQNKINEIKNQFIIENKNTEIYLEEIDNLLTRLRQKFLEMAKMFYPKKKSGLLIENNIGENQLRFNIEAKIEDDSSDGVNEVKIFCFDLLLLLQKKTPIDFLMHDSRLLANMDPRQRATLYRVAYDACEEGGFQYITTINEDALLSIESIMDLDEFEKIIGNSVVLTLKDDSAESKLLGIQVDMDLEKQ